MKKQTSTKTISSLILLFFVVSVFLVSPQVQAVSETNLSSLYSNPNQYSGNNPYKFKISDVVNSSLLTNIVGCTGVVNRVSEWMSKIVQSKNIREKIEEKSSEKIKDQLKAACASTKAGVETGAGTVVAVNDLTSPVKTAFQKIQLKVLGQDVKACLDQVEAIDPKALKELEKQSDQEIANTFKEQCFDGIALTLARNQLTAMTRSAMNWVNTGYGGNPFFVQNMRNFTEGIERNVVETGIDVLLAPNGQQSPYASDFARSAIYSKGLGYSSAEFLGGLQSNLQNFITDPQSYYTNDQLDDAYNTRTALENAQYANETFSRSFASGGWNAWLAFTQTPQNNPLGFNMIANQYLADMEMQQVQEKKDELAQNNGFLSQKTCIKWQLYNVDGSAKTKNYSAQGSTNNASTRRPDGTLKTRAELERESVQQLAKSTEFVFSTSQPYYEQEDGENEFGKCVDWKVTTPGSIIKEKTTNYLNSPERQLELAKTINDSLNALFSVLISKLQGGGLSGLSDSVVTTNWTDNINEVGTGYDGNTPYDNNGAYDGFNLTRDLGNTYIHENPILLGTWNAKTNLTNPIKDTKIEAGALYPDLAPGYYNADEKFVPYNYSYYTVSTAGNTKLIVEGHNGWEVGDRAFWDGAKWQNWKKGQTSPIKSRGVIQVQQDYIVAAKEIMKVLPTVMTNLGELDYCLPGPNPSYKTNSTDAQSAYQDWIGSMYVGPKDEHRTEWRIDHEDGRTYKNLASIFTDNPNTWDSILKSSLMSPLNDFDRNWIRSTNEKRTIAGKILSAIPAVSIGRIFGIGDLAKTGSCVAGGRNPDGTCQNYHYDPTQSNGELGNIDNRKQYMEETLDLVNNYLFQDFYKEFDKQMNTLYFKNMTSMYNDTEMSVGVNKNPAYIPMAESGFDLTKNISYYNDDISKAVKDYSDAISQAKINIAKLEPIKSEVSGIIKAAQGRRDANLVKILNDEAKRSGGKVLTPKEYATKYAGCLEEENISFYDPDEITGMKDVNAENCIDGIDNDLNGLTDKNDPQCPGYIDPEASGLRTSGASGSRR